MNPGLLGNLTAGSQCKFCNSAPPAYKEPFILLVYSYVPIRHQVPVGAAFSAHLIASTLLFPLRQFHKKVLTIHGKSRYQSMYENSDISNHPLL